MAQYRYGWVVFGFVLTVFALGYILPSCNWAMAASGSCRASCKAAYGACYNSTGGDRKRCDRQYKRCLENCLKSSNIN